MAKVRDVSMVDRDLRRTKRAEAKLRKNMAHIMRRLSLEGGIDGLPKKGEPAKGKPQCSPNLRLLREVSKALKITVDEVRTLTAEKAALELQVKETTDEYAL